MNMKLKYAYGAAMKTSDSGQGESPWNKTEIYESNGVSVIAMGEAGERTEGSRRYAWVVAEAAAALIARRFDELYSAEEEDFVRTELLLKTMEVLSEENGISLSRAADSLLFVAVKENRYLAGHMGGGLIVRWDGNPSILSKPGTEEPVMSNLRVYKGEFREPFGFMLISDNGYSSFYDAETEGLSPACGTFFEWLREYDEETVSEAFADNMKKYFLQDAKGDIRVAAVVSDENDGEGDAEPALEPENGADIEPQAEVELQEEIKPEAALPEGVVGSDGSEVETEVEKAVRERKAKLIKSVLALLIVLVGVTVFALTQLSPAPADVKGPESSGETESKAPISPAESVEGTEGAGVEPLVSFAVENPEYYEAGRYKAGVDIPAGEYFFWTGDMLEPGKIIVNDDTCLSDELYCMTIELKDWDTLISDYSFTPAENVNPVKAVGGTLISGKYKVGKDIEPGTYQISPAGQRKEGRYYSIYDEEISNDKKFSSETAVTVPEKGYIVFYNGVLSVGQE